MKIQKHILNLWCISIAISSISGLVYADLVKLNLQPESQIELRGKSTLHDYESVSTKTTVEAEIESSGKPVFQTIKENGLKKLFLDVPVAGLKSGKDGLDKNMQKSLKEKENPSITFEMTRYSIESSTIPAHEWIKALGQLEIAGVKKEVEVVGLVSQTVRGILIEGEKDLLMTDFGIKPPTMLLIKTDNHIKVLFKLNLDQ